MPSLHESELENDFKELRARLGQPAALNPAQSDPIFYFVYRPELTLVVQQRLPGWMGALRHAGLEPVRLSLHDVARALIVESGRWEEWLELEADAEPEQLNAALHDVLTQDNALTERVARRVTEGAPNTVYLLTEAELLHPNFRTRTLETALTGRAPRSVVIFYPGRRLGQYGLQFLGFYPEDGNYRATIIGGTA